MSLSPSTLLNLGLALMLIYSAISTLVGTLKKRTVSKTPPRDQPVVSPKYRYTRAQIEKAIQRAIDNIQTNEPQPGGYPQVFSNDRKLSFPSACNGKTLYEFPLLHGDRIYSGGDHGADRVVFCIYTSTSDTNPMQNGACCGVVTHDGALTDEVALCPVED